MSATDTKRAWVDDNTSPPYGHHSLEAIEPPAKKAKIEKVELHKIHESLLPINQVKASTSKILPCISCNKICNNQYNLKSHKCKNIQPKLFSCTICDKIFNNEYNYKMHMGCKHLI